MQHNDLGPGSSVVLAQLIPALAQIQDVLLYGNQLHLGTCLVCGVVWCGVVHTCIQAHLLTRLYIYIYYTQARRGSGRLSRAATSSPGTPTYDSCSGSVDKGRTMQFIVCVHGLAASAIKQFLFTRPGAGGEDVHGYLACPYRCNAV